jgi:hypothetical protein
VTIECTRCKAQNPDGKRFCGDCGGPLDPALVAMRELMGTTLREQVHEVVKEHYKDQKIVELETTQAIASRLLDWAKLLGFFVGIPIAILFLILGALGIKTYSDFSGQVDKAQKDITAHLTDAQTRAAKLKADGEALSTDYEKLRAQFADTKALAEQLETLSKKVDVIGEKLGFTPSSKISAEARSRLETAFPKFQQYLRGLGYRGSADTISVDIREKMETGALAYYDPDKRMMVIDSKHADDPVILYREYAHRVLYSLGTPSDPDSTFGFYYAIESGLAWYLPCSFVNSPKPTTAVAWDLTKKRSFGELRPEIGSAMNNGTEIWGSAFWEMRVALGQDVVDKSLFDAWFKLRPEEARSDQGVSFVRKLMDIDRTHQAQIRAIFTRRGLAL